MRIHDLATLIVLAAQHPDAPVHSCGIAGDNHYWDHARCLVDTSHKDDLAAMFIKNPTGWEVETTNEVTEKTCCMMCGLGGWTRWPEEPCVFTTS